MLIIVSSILLFFSKPIVEDPTEGRVCRDIVEWYGCSALMMALVSQWFARRNRPSGAREPEISLSRMTMNPTKSISFVPVSRQHVCKYSCLGSLDASKRSIRLSKLLGLQTNRRRSTSRTDLFKHLLCFSKSYLNCASL
jgi:hypothetical protein